MSDAAAWIQTRLRRAPQALAATSAALWGLVGRPVTRGDLQWACRLLGDEGPMLLWNTLHATGVLGDTPPVIRPQELAALVASWTGAPCHPSLTVTLPPWLGVALPALPMTRDVIAHLITTATREVCISTPYMDREGIGLLIEPLRAVASRGVQITVATHHLDDPQSPNARALALLYAEAPGVCGIHLPSIVRTTEGVTEVLLVHAKLVIVDDHAALIGSANLTRAGLMGNIEVGVMIQGPGVAQARLVWHTILATASRSARG